MQVLKKFGFFSLILLFAGINLHAQTVENCSTNKTGSVEKKDPIEFIHNHVLKASASNPVGNVKVIYTNSAKKTNKSNPVVTPQQDDKKTATVLKPTIEKTKAVAQLKSKETNTTSDVEAEKPQSQPQVMLIERKTIPFVSIPSTTAVNNDLASSRTVTKTIEPKEEEQSFGSSMMEWVKDKYSVMIDVLPNQISNVMLYRFIDDWYGVKYRMGGTSKKGVDCSAFVQTLYKYVFGMDLLRTACLQFNSAELIKNPADLKEGDLVFFRVNSSRISHVGVYLRNNFFVHSASSKGVSIANLNNVYWSKYFAGGGRINRKL